MRISFVCAACALSVPVMASVVRADALVPDNGSGTADFPPVAGQYINHPSFPQLHIIDGLPPGSPINIDVTLGGFFNRTPAGVGLLGGGRMQWNGTMTFHLVGTGVYLGFNRTINMSVTGNTDIAPYGLGPVQNFDTFLYTLQGQVFGDPDFDLLRITAGNGFGLPSPGHTTLTQAGPNWTMDSFFDIFYRIDFVGAPGGTFAGRSGSTTGDTRIYLVPAPGAAGVLALGGLIGSRRRRT